MLEKPGDVRSVGDEERGVVTERLEVDPLVENVRMWIARQNLSHEIIREWQRLETELFSAHGAMTPREASRRGHAQGPQMRALDACYKFLARRLNRDAKRLARTQSQSRDGALAKIEMGLHIQDPIDSEDYSWELVSSGFKELRTFL